MNWALLKKIKGTGEEEEPRIDKQMNNFFRALGDKIFLRLYLSQAISLLGDAFTWVGIALLAYEFGGDRSSLLLLDKVYGDSFQEIQVLMNSGIIIS